MPINLCHDIKQPEEAKKNNNIENSEQNSEAYKKTENMLNKIEKNIENYSPKDRKQLNK